MGCQIHGGGFWRCVARGVPSLQMHRFGCIPSDLTNVQRFNGAQSLPELRKPAFLLQIGGLYQYPTPLPNHCRIHLGRFGFLFPLKLVYVATEVHLIWWDIGYPPYISQAWRVIRGDLGVEEFLAMFPSYRNHPSAFRNY